MNFAYKPTSSARETHAREVGFLLGEYGSRIESFTLAFQLLLDTIHIQSRPLGQPVRPFCYMINIFIDESGDLGFDFRKKKTSRYFVMAMLYAEKKEPVERMIKKFYRQFREMKINRSSVLHSYKETDETRRRVLKALNVLGVHIYGISIDKKTVPINYREDTHVLYGILVSKLLAEVIRSERFHDSRDAISLFLDRRGMNRSVTNEFINRLTKDVKDKFGISVLVKITSLTAEKGLQAVDFASWAFYQKAEFNDESYLKLLEMFKEVPNPFLIHGEF